MTGSTLAATANVMWRLPAGAARAALVGVLEHTPDVVGLQEWGLSRIGLLAETGAVVPLVGRARLPRLRRAGDYTWVAPLESGCPVGLRTERFTILDARQRVLSGVGLDDRVHGPVRPSRPRIATLVVVRDTESAVPLSIVVYHLTPGVQWAGRYREDRPRAVARHREEVRRLGRLVTGQVRAGHTVLAMGDSNLDGLRLPGLVSAWEGRAEAPGTLGPRRKVDDVHGPSPAAEVRLLTTASDHRAVVVRRT